MKTKFLACLLGIVLAGTSQAFAGSHPAPTSIALDTVVVRPVCFAATIVGTALFVLALTIAATSHSVHRAADALVVKPGEATFKRKLGDLDELFGT
jgi:hypothetical protein